MPQLTGEKKNIFSPEFHVPVSTEGWNVNYRTQLFQVNILLIAQERSEIVKVKRNSALKSEKWMGSDDRVDTQSYQCQHINTSSHRFKL